MPQRQCPLQIWANENKPDDKLIYKGGFWDQVIFFRDTIPSIFAASSTYEEFIGIRELMEVVSTHTSKSVTLPVVEVKWHDVSLTMRYNFYDWKVSVSYFRGDGLDTDFHDLFKEDAEINGVYCEGFKDRWVYGPFSKDKKKFTVELSNNYVLWTFLWLIKDYVLKFEERRK